MRIIITEGSILETNVGMPRARQDHCPWRGKVEEQILGRREAELQQELQSRGDHKKHRDKSPGQVLQCLLKGRAALQVLNRGDWDGVGWGGSNCWRPHAPSKGSPPQGQG